MLPAYMTTVRSPAPISSRYAVARSPTVKRSTSTKFGITRTVEADPIFSTTFSCRSLDKTVTASARRYTNRSSHRRIEISRRFVIAPTSTATSGKMSCTLKTKAARRRRATTQPGNPRVSGGDMTSTTSGRRRRNNASIPAKPVNPTNPSARAEILVLSVGNGCTRVIEPQVVRSVRHKRPRHSGSTSWCWYQGSDVTRSS